VPEAPAADPVRIRVASPPETPLLIFDGDCGFCRFWVARWRGLLEGRADFEPYRTAAPRFPEIPVERFRQAVGLILPDGSLYSGAEAVFRALALRPGAGAPLALYRFRPFAAAAEGLYGAIAAHRDLAAAATHAAWGENPRAPTHRRSRRLFLGTLGAISLVAFLSLGIQVDGLIGVRGIAPAGELLAAAHRHGVRVMGPNCIGLMRLPLGLNATFARGHGLPGTLALVSQSGAVCTAMLDWATSNGVGFSSVISLGRYMTLRMRSTAPARPASRKAASTAL